MLTEIYIEALLVNEELADQVWEAWDAGKLGNAAACIAWVLIAGLVWPMISIETFQKLRHRLGQPDFDAGRSNSRKSGEADA